MTADFLLGFGGPNLLGELGLADNCVVNVYHVTEFGATLLDEQLDVVPILLNKSGRDLCAHGVTPEREINQIGVLPATCGHCLPVEGGASGLSPRQADHEATCFAEYTVYP